MHTTNNLNLKLNNIYSHMSLLQLKLAPNAFTPLSHPSHPSHRFRPNRTIKIRAVGTVPDQKNSETTQSNNEPPSIGFAFVSSALLPDGTPDVHYRSATGGQKLRNIMLNSNIELYGPYGRLLLNCGGGGTCATCMVEVLEGKELLNPRTEKENEKLKRKPKNWRLACQTVVGEADSTGVVVIQQLPEWKGHEWNYEKGDDESAESS